MELFDFPKLTNNCRVHLMPDGAVIYMPNMDFGENINESALNILLLCNGKMKISEIIAELQKKYNENYDTVYGFVTTFLQECELKKYIQINDASEHKIKITGSTEFYSPRSASIEIYPFCNFNCEHCYVIDHIDNNISLTSEIINYLKELSVVGVNVIQLTGGEPLLHPDFKEIFYNACTFFDEIAITSNGSLIDESLASYLLDTAQLNSSSVIFQISLDGPKEIHNKVRRKKSAFEETINGIKMLVKKSIPVRLAFTINRENLDYIEETVKIAKELGVGAFEIANTISSGRAKYSDKLITNEEELENIAKEIIKIKNKYNDENFFINDWEYKGMDDMHAANAMPTNCGLGLNSIAISSNGDVFPCLVHREKIGSLKGNNIINILNSNKWKNYSKLPAPSFELCEGCEKQMFCKSCIGLASENAINFNDCKWLPLLTKFIHEN